MQCKNCRANLADTSVFCSQCGIPLYGKSQQNITFMPQVPFPQTAPPPGRLSAPSVPMVQGTPLLSSAPTSWVAPLSPPPTDAAQTIHAPYKSVPAAKVTHHL